MRIDQAALIARGGSQSSCTPGSQSGLDVAGMTSVTRRRGRGEWCAIEHSLIERSGFQRPEGGRGPSLGIGAYEGKTVRVDLKVSFEQKDQAKALGARWDVARKIWYIVDMEDLGPFLRWMPSPMAAWQAKKTKAPHRGGHRPAFSPRKDFSLPDCDCSSAPWDHCEHTRETPLTGDELAHIRSI